MIAEVNDSTENQVHNNRILLKETEGSNMNTS